MSGNRAAMRALYAEMQVRVAKLQGSKKTQHAELDNFGLQAVAGKVARTHARPPPDRPSCG